MSKIFIIQKIHPLRYGEDGYDDVVDVEAFRVEADTHKGAAVIFAHMMNNQMRTGGKPEMCGTFSVEDENDNFSRVEEFEIEGTRVSSRLYEVYHIMSAVCITHVATYTCLCAAEFVRETLMNNKIHQINSYGDYAIKCVVQE